MKITRKDRDELNEISKEVFGFSSRWYDLIPYFSVDPAGVRQILLEEKQLITDSSILSELSLKAFKDAKIWKSHMNQMGFKCRAQMKLFMEEIIAHGDKIVKEATLSANKKLAENNSQHLPGNNS